jgi:hypothetical protein
MSMNGDFLTWWKNEGNALLPTPSKDSEAYARKVCHIAWENGAFKAKSPQDPIAYLHRETGELAKGFEYAFDADNWIPLIRGDL